MKLFLDDIRYPPDCYNYMSKRIGELNKFYLDQFWLIARNYNEFCMMLERYIDEIEVISFDHDLADEHMLDYHKNQYNNIDLIEYENFKEKTGVDCAKFTKELYKSKNKTLPLMFCHSMNPIGTQNIINVWKN